MVATSTKCYSDVMGAGGCPSKCAKKRRWEGSEIGNWQTEVVTIAFKDEVPGPCC